jgi:hypothetical protein
MANEGCGLAAREMKPGRKIWIIVAVIALLALATVVALGLWQDAPLVNTHY